MIEFTIQPCDHRERSGKQLVATITGLFPQLLTMSLSLFTPFFLLLLLVSASLTLSLL